MKKMILFVLFAVIFVSAGYAQSIAKNAIGLRIGDNDGFGAEVSYQRGLSENNRLEFDLGWRSSNDIDAFKLAALYQWVWNIDGGFNWYAGAGGGIGSFETLYHNGTFVFAAGDIGIEYNFDIPLLISVDMRPEIGFNDDYSDDLDLDIALSIRYQF